MTNFKNCQLQACRRARRCVGNKPVCMPRCAFEFVPGGEREAIEELYANIQQERCDAAAEGRAPNVIRAMTHRVHEEYVTDDIEPAPAPANVEPEIPAVAQPPRSVAAVSFAGTDSVYGTR